MVAKKGESSQNISRTDILCEGPVKGLKHGAASIFLNDVASDDSTLRAYEPVQTATSGRITFNGSSATNTGITGASLPTNLRNDGRVPRKVTLIDYKTTNVTLSSVSESGGNTTLTCTASSGTPFTDTSWNTTTATATRKAFLKRDGVEIAGVFEKTSSSAGTFFFWGVSDVIDTAETHTLQVSYSFFLDEINSSSSLTLLTTPASGTYYFRIEAQQQGNNRNSFRKKIDGIQAQFRPGGRYQNPLDEIGGVGGSVAGTQSVNHELKVIGTGEISGISPVSEILPTGTTMESGLPDDSQNDVASAATVLADTAFGITAAQRPEVDEISIRITYPGGLQSMNNNKGRRDPAYARYLIQIQTTLNGISSDWENAFPDAGAYVEHTGRTNAAYSFDHVLGVNQYRPFDSFKIRIIRLTRHIGLRVNEKGHGDGVTDKEKWTLIAKSKVDQLGFVIKDRLSYPYTSLVSTSFSSKQYQEPPKMSYLMQGLLVKVPSTYTPREYSGDGIAKYEEFWDGTFKTELQYTDNPAWVFYDIVTNNRYGAGKWIRESDIDKYALYRIARYCDELVDNGAGGTEPRFRANVFLTKATDVYKVLKDFASIFTGMLYWMDSSLVAVQDSPADPVYNFTKGNVIEGKFSYESTGLKTRPNQIVVTWNDPESNYEPVPIIIEDREAIVRDRRILKEDATAFGCTSEAQAIRYGRWKLWTAQKQTEIISFRSALNSLYIKPGDIVNVQDADREGVQYSGRVASATNTSVVLDRSVTLNSGSTYTLSTLVTESAAFYVGEDDVTVNSITYSRGDRIPQAYVYSSGSYSLIDLNTEARASNAFEDSSGSNLLPIVWKEYSFVQEDAVTTSASTTNTLDVTSFGTTPSASTIWSLKEVADSLNVTGSYKQYKVLSITQDKPNEYAFSAVEHYNEKYGAVDNGYATSDIPTTIYVEAEPRDGETEMAAPTSPRVILESDPDKPGEEIKVEWQASTSDFVESYEVLHNIPDIENPLRTSQTFLRITGITSDRLTFEVRAVSTGGNYSPYAKVSYTFLDPYEDAIPRVAQGIPSGGFSSAQLIVTALNTLQFQATNTQVSTPSDPETIYTLTGSTNVANISADEDYLVYLDTSVPALKILYYDTESLSSSFYYDVGSGNTPLSSSWTSIGSVSVSANSNTVTGSGFLTNVIIGDVLNLAGTTSPTDLADGAVVIDVVSDTELRIDKIFDTAKSSVTAYRANFRPGYLDDTIIGKLRKTESTVKLTSLLTLRTIVDGITLSTGDDGTTEVPDGAITVDKLAANSITADKIQANAITAREIDADSINANHIVAGEITADAIAANAITADKVTANSVVATLLTASAVTATEISTTNLSSISANIGDITAGTLKGGNIPDANAAPGTGESGAFLNLTGGKMVFGNESKYVLFDGTNLELNGVVIDATSTVNATATPELIVKEDSTTEVSDASALNFTSGLNVAVSGTEATISIDTPTDNNFTNALLSKLNGIESAATGDQTAAEIRSLVESASDSNVFTDADHTKLNNIEAGATGDQTAAEIRALVASASDSNVFTDADHSKLDGIESGATADQSAAEIRALVESASNSNVFTDADHTKLNGIAAGANAYVLPTNNVTNASVSGSTLTLTREGAGNVTFTDTNTQYSAGSGLGLSGTTFSVDSTVVRTTGTQSIAGNKTFTGDVTFNGTTTYINTTTLNVGDNIITLNADFTGSNPTESAGIEVERGTQTNKTFIWKESSDRWSFGSESVEAGTFFGSFIGSVTGSPSSLAGLSTDDLAEGSTNLYFTNTRARGALSGGTGISYNNTTGAITNSAPDQTVTLTGGGATSISGTYPNFTISSTDTNTVPNNATITISAGTDLSTGGDFTTDQDFAETITINHANITRTNNTSSVSPGYGASFTAIDSITTNTRGHVTAVNTKTITIPASDNTDTNTVTQIREDSGTYRTGNITLQSGTNVSITESSAGVFNFAATDTNTTNFNIQASGGASTNISAGQTINFTGSGATSVSRSGNTITFTSTDTNTDTNYFLNGISKSGNTLTFSVSGATNQSYTFGSNAFTSTTIPTNNNQLINGAGYTTNIGDITAVTAGNGLTGGASSGAATLNVGAGDGISVAANAVAVDSTVLRAGTGSLINDIINANVITADMIQANSIVATLIDADTISANNITTGTLDATNVTISNLTANNITGDVSEHFNSFFETPLNKRYAFTGGSNAITTTSFSVPAPNGGVSKRLYINGWLGISKSSNDQRVIVFVEQKGFTVSSINLGQLLGASGDSPEDNIRELTYTGDVLGQGAFPGGQISADATFDQDGNNVDVWGYNYDSSNNRTTIWVDGTSDAEFRPTTSNDPHYWHAGPQSASTWVRVGETIGIGDFSTSSLDPYIVVPISFVLPAQTTSGQIRVGVVLAPGETTSGYAIRGWNCNFGWLR